MKYIPIDLSKPPADAELSIYFMRSYDFSGDAIAALCDGSWSHTGLMVQDLAGKCIVYEAILADNAIDKRDAIPRFQSFLADDPRNRLCILPLPRALLGYADAEIDLVVHYAEACVGDVTYATGALLGLAFAQRLGINLPDSPSKQVCSEFVARVLGGGDHEAAAPIVCDLRDDRHNAYCLVTPDSVFRRACAVMSGVGDFTNPAITRRTPF